MPVNATIAVADVDAAARAARDARDAGFRTVKVKVGLGNDRRRVAAVRDAIGPDRGVRLDANGAWTVDEAMLALERLAPLGIELCEEPVHGVDEIEQVARLSGIHVAIDETASQPEALRRRVCHAACLKLQACGGLTGLMRATGQARAVGYEVYVASSLDGPLGIAAALHAACALRIRPACGLATLDVFADRTAPWTPSAGRLACPDGPGLGDGLLDWYRAA